MTDLIQMNTDAALLKFVKDYLDASIGSFDRDPPTSEFARGYAQGLRSLQSVMNSIEKSAKGE
jgi:hypothetical protein